MRVNALYKILIISYSFSIFSEGILLPIYAVFVQGIGGDVLDASSAMAVFLISQGIFTILVHRLQFGPRHRIAVMILGWAIWVSGIALYLVVSNVLMLFLTQVLTALGNAVADPIFDGELARHTDKKSEEFEWGFFEGSTSLVQGIAALVGGVVVVTFGFDMLLLVMVGAATISLFTIIFYSFRARRTKLSP